MKFIKQWKYLTVVWKWLLPAGNACGWNWHQFVLYFIYMYIHVQTNILQYGILLRLNQLAFFLWQFSVIYEYMGHMVLYVNFIHYWTSIWGKGTFCFSVVGISVRHNDTSYLMHHKFVVIDQAIMINGSFNWTRHAVNCNNENVLITNEQELVIPFMEEFEKLWTDFDPMNQQGGSKLSWWWKYAMDLSYHCTLIYRIHRNKHPMQALEKINQTDSIKIPHN